MKIILYSNDISARSYLMDNSDNQLDLTNFNMCIARMNNNDDYIQHLMDWYHNHMLQRLTTEHESEIPKFNMDDLSYQIESNIGIRVVVALEITQDTFAELRKTPWKDILIVLVPDYSNLIITISQLICRTAASFIRSYWNHLPENSHK